jgi:hypothetical protein
MVCRWAITVLGGSALLAACSGSGSSGASTVNPTPAGPEVVSTGTETCADPFAGQRPGFSAEGWNTNFCKHSVPFDEIVSGGPPRDGIPPIDEPKFVSIAEADRWMSAKEPVIDVHLGGEARAYPLQIMMWHEIVNDTIGDTPVAVTFCPLCYASLTFVRPEVDGQLLTFGVSGNLRKSDLVMWDRQTESWWQQFTGEAIVGRLTGKTLTPVPSNLIAWETFKQKHGDGARVLSRETGYERPYGQNPYVGYDDMDQHPYMLDGQVGDRLPPMARLVGVEVAHEGRAYPYEVLEQQRVVNDTLGGRQLVVFWSPGVVSAVDTAEIAAGQDVGATEVFARRVAGKVLTFEAMEDGRFRDRETGSIWDHGRAVSGPFQGETLEPLIHHDVFWFVWSAFKDEGDLYEP